MNIVKYVFPIIIIVLLIAFIIYASTVENFRNHCVCPDGSELKNGGCYSCEKGYTLSKDYYNPYCVRDTSGTGKYITAAIYKFISC